MFDALFSHFCHQIPERSFAFGGAALPFCHRCAGVYVGAVAAAALLASFGLSQRRTLPRPVLVVNILFLLAMGVFGFHLVETPPVGRYVVGAAFGSAVVMLSWPLVFARLSRHRGPAWSAGDHVRYAVVLCAALAGLPLVFGSGPAWLAGVFAAVGLLGLALVVLLPNVLLAQVVVRSSAVRRRTPVLVLVVLGLLASETLLIAGW